MKKKFLAISIPTGIGLDIGGFAGDFGYIAREFSKYFKLIVNPNAVNGGILSAVNPDMFYVEGYAFDEFLCGNLNLKAIEAQNKIGIIFDKAIPKNILNIHINTLNALKIVEGFDILPYEVTENPVGIGFSINKETKISSGNIKDATTLLKSAEKLLQKGARVLAVVCFFPDYNEEDDANYVTAQGVDPIGGVEAVISHLLVKKFNVPCAHSPAFSTLDISNNEENPKVAAEIISSTYLPCVIRGLAFAPNFVYTEGISNKDIEGLIVPSKALGSKGVLGASKKGIKIFCVDNKTPLNIGVEELNMSATMHFEDYFSCLKYLREKL